MAARLCLFLVVLLFPLVIPHDSRRQMVIWNVGQGQWVSIISNSECWHFDMGGEFAPWRKIMEKCRTRANFVWLSHWDWDHIGFAGKAKFYLPNICLIQAPLGSSTPNKVRTINRLPKCKKQRQNGKVNIWQPDFTSQKSENAKSAVYSVGQVLIPGDSPRSEEKIWVSQREALTLDKAQILIVGHHGSKTSTSKKLLRELSRLNLAIVSARHRRYGHPHPQVVRDFSRFKVPLLKTEDWGSITVELN